MGTTELNGLPYPEPTAQPFVHLDIRSLAEAIDAQLLIACTSTARPAHRAGRQIFETDTKRTLISDGSTWICQQGPVQQARHAGHGGDKVIGSSGELSVYPSGTGPASIETRTYDCAQEVVATFTGAALVASGSSAGVGTVFIALNDQLVGHAQRVDTRNHNNEPQVLSITTRIWIPSAGEHKISVKGKADISSTHFSVRDSALTYTYR